MERKRRRGRTLAGRLLLVVLTALGVAGAALLAGFGALQWLETTRAFTAFCSYDLLLSALLGGTLSLFTVTLVLGGLMATRRREDR